MSTNKIFNDNNCIILYDDKLEIGLKQVFSKLTNTKYNESQDILIVDVSIQPAVAIKNSDFVRVIIDQKDLFMDFLKATDTESSLVNIEFVNNILLFTKEFVTFPGQTAQINYEELSTGTKQLIIIMYYFIKLSTNKNHIIVFVNIHLHTLLYNYIRRMFDENTKYKSIIYVTNTDLTNIKYSTTVFDEGLKKSIISTTELINIIDEE